VVIQERVTFSILFAFSWLTDVLLFLDKMGRQGQMLRTMDDGSVGYGVE
jgi:hypothetical protein